MDSLEIIITSSLLILLLILVVGGLVAYYRKPSKPDWRNQAEDKLTELVELSNKGNSFMMKTAIIELDTLIDFILINKKVKGSTLGERLKNSEELFHSSHAYQKAWDGHKVRNSLAHDINFKAENNILKQAFYDLTTAVKDLLQ